MLVMDGGHRDSHEAVVGSSRGQDVGALVLH